MVKRSVNNINDDNVNKFFIYLIPVLLLIFVIIILSIAVYYSLSYNQTPNKNGELNSLAISQEPVKIQENPTIIEKNTAPQEYDEPVLPENIPLQELEPFSP